jgi:hypothetical protein
VETGDIFLPGLSSRVWHMAYGIWHRIIVLKDIRVWHMAYGIWRRRIVLKDNTIVVPGE